MSNLSSPQPRGMARSAMEREAPQMPQRGPGVVRAMHVRPATNGNTNLIDAETGDVISPCSSAAVAEKTRSFFAK